MISVALANPWVCEGLVPPASPQGMRRLANISCIQLSPNSVSQLASFLFVANPLLATARHSVILCTAPYSVLLLIKSFFSAVAVAVDVDVPGPCSSNVGADWNS